MPSGCLSWGGLIYGGALCDEAVVSPPTSGCAGYFAYGGAVYEGLLCEGVSGVTPTPGSNVRNLDDSRGRLGCGEPVFFLTARCNNGVSCVVTDYVTSATWNRVLDDVSEAEVTLDFGGSADFSCCECLVDVEPWCHELHIWRDGEEVWVGPVQQIEYSYNSVIIRAVDSLGWLSVRVIPGNIDYSAVAADLTDIAIDILNSAFAEDSGNGITCELDNIFSVDSGEVSFRFFEQFTDNALNWILDLSQTGLNITTLGRTIVLTGDDTALTPLILLNDEHIIGDIKVTKDGSSQGNRYYVHFEGDGGVPASGEATDFFCYGPIERLRDGDGLVDGVSAGDVADAYVRASAIAPRRVEIESGSKLSPDTPWTMNQMVCGARVDVAVTRLCLNLTQSFILTGVDVTYNANDGESIGITLTPINDVDVA